MSSVAGSTGVVSTFDPSSFEVVWRDIPGFSAYQASNLGTIRHKRIGRYSRLYEVKTSLGSYLRVSAISDDGRFRSKEVHHLVCLAFHGEPPSEDHEVNHDDGNKHNNLPGNLEWSTRGDNLKHAYKTGLRKENRRVDVFDHNECSRISFYSMNELARAFNVSPRSVWTLITNHTEKRYNDRFTFEFVNPEGVVANKHARVRSVKALDYVNRKLYMANDLGQLELHTGVKRNTIYYSLVRGKIELVKGFVFLYDDSGIDFPAYTEEQVKASLLTKNGKNTALKVTDTLTNTTEVYGGFPDLVKAFGLKHPNEIRRKMDETGKYRHYLIESITSSSPKA